jgi:hypothetical protein
MVQRFITKERENANRLATSSSSSLLTQAVMFNTNPTQQFGLFYLPLYVPAFKRILHVTIPWDDYGS